MRAISLAAALLVAAPLYGASRFDPALRFRTLTTDHFVIYFHQGGDALAARLAAIAEDAWRALQPSLGVPAQKRTHVVLADQSELANGSAFPLPYNTIVVHAAWPAGSDFIGHVDDWLRLVFTHEYTHIVHLDRSGGYARFLRRMFGRTPLAFPNLFLPLWHIEGLATYEESALTGAGRVHAGDFRSIGRAAARAQALEPIDRVNGGLTSWPGGNAPYAYGAGFHEHLAVTYGDEKFAALADKTARRVPFLGAGAYPQIYGKPLHVLWREYQGGLRAEAAVPARTAPTRLTHHGFTVVGPRFAPAACAACAPEIVYSVRTPDGFPALNAVSLDGAAPRQLATRYLGSTAGVGSGVVVFDQHELQRNVALHSDLYALDRATSDVRRLTRGARLLDPDLSPDGSTIVCVREGLGRREIVTVRLKPDTTGDSAAVADSAADAAAGVSGFSRTISVLVSQPDTQFNAPRWSPDGASVVVERHLPGRTPDVVIVDIATRAVRPIASDPAVRFVTPAWRPDGMAIVAAGARAGEPFNLYEFDGSVARLLTDTTDGATWPDVSPDGSTLLFVGYTEDGFDLFTMPYPAPDAIPTDVGPIFRSGAPGAPGASPDARAEARAYTPAQPPGSTAGYNPLPTLMPTSWQPILEADGDDVRLGAAIGGDDVLGYHAYRASATWRASGPATPASPSRVDWTAAYAYDRWRPTVFLAASGDTSFGPDFVVRSHETEAGVVLPLRRVRVAHQALASIVRITDRYDGSTEAAVNRTAARTGWATSTARFYGFSVSPEHGVTAGLAAEIVREAIGATAGATTVTADFRAYLPGFRPHHVVAVRAGGGVSNGDERARRTFLLGGASPNPSVVDFSSDAFSLLRGFEPDSFAGSRVAVANADYRWPLARPERGIRTWPVFLHTLHASVFADAAHAWTGRFRARDVKTSAGAELSADLIVGYSARITVAAGAAWGRDAAASEPHRAAVYVRAGRAF